MGPIEFAELVQYCISGCFSGWVPDPIAFVENGGGTGTKTQSRVLFW